jgi:hypothetical protein
VNMASRNNPHVSAINATAHSGAPLVPHQYAAQPNTGQVAQFNQGQRSALELPGIAQPVRQIVEASIHNVEQMSREDLEDSTLEGKAWKDVATSQGYFAAVQERRKYRETQVNEPLGSQKPSQFLGAPQQNLFFGQAPQNQSDVVETWKANPTSGHEIPVQLIPLAKKPKRTNKRVPVIVTKYADINHGKLFEGAQPLFLTEKELIAAMGNHTYDVSTAKAYCDKMSGKLAKRIGARIATTDGVPELLDTLNEQLGKTTHPNRKVFGPDAVAALTALGGNRYDSVPALVQAFADHMGKDKTASLIQLLNDGKIETQAGKKTSKRKTVKHLLQIILLHAARITQPDPHAALVAFLHKCLLLVDFKNCPSRPMVAAFVSACVTLNKDLVAPLKAPEFEVTSCQVNAACPLVVAVMELLPQKQPELAPAEAAAPEAAAPEAAAPEAAAPEAAAPKAAARASVEMQFECTQVQNLILGSQVEGAAHTPGIDIFEELFGDSPPLSPINFAGLADEVERPEFQDVQADQAAADQQKQREHEVDLPEFQHVEADQAAAAADQQKQRKRKVKGAFLRFSAMTVNGVKEALEGELADCVSEFSEEQMATLSAGSKKAIRKHLKHLKDQEEPPRKKSKKMTKVTGQVHQKRDDGSC